MGELGQPVLNLITQNVIETLGGVRRNAGYFHDLNVEEEDEQGNRARDSQAIVYVEGDPRPEEDPPLGHDGWHQRYSILCRIVESEVSGLPPSTRLAQIEADVIKAMQEDHNRGGYAHNTVTLAPERFPKSTPPAVIVGFDVHYRHLKGQPTKQ
jgi:hypothetical protein